MDHDKEAEQRLAEATASLRAYIAQEQKLHEDLTAELAASTNRLHRAERAVTALEQSKPRPRRSPVVRSIKAVSRGRLDQVLMAVQEHGPLTASQATERTGLSESAVRNALHVLREQGLLRYAGVAENVRNAPRPPMLYATMPNAS